MCTELVPLLLTIFVPAICHLWVPSTHILLRPFFFLTSAIATSLGQVNTAKRKTSNTLQPGTSSSARVGALNSRTDIPVSHLFPCSFLSLCSSILDLTHLSLYSVFDSSLLFLMVNIVLPKPHIWQCSPTVTSLALSVP